MSVIEKRRLYHFTTTKWALVAIRDRRLKAAELENTNDLFEAFPRRWETVEQGETNQYWRRRRTQSDRYSWRILSFSKTCTNPLLWGHYADNGKGIALGFDTNGSEYLKGAAYPVSYKACRVESGGSIDREEFAIGISQMQPAFIKSQHWEHEQEWRMFAQVPSLDLCPITGMLYFPFEGRMTLREVLIGPRRENDNVRYQIAKLIRDYYPRPKIVSMKLSSSHFRVERESSFQLPFPDRWSILTEVENDP